MKTAKEYSDTAKREVSVDVDALLAVYGVQLTDLLQGFFRQC